jgi:ferredoxin
MAKTDLKFGKKLKEYGAIDFNACYNCGTCTAVCSLSTEEDSFPREMVRLSVLGQSEDITASLKPWLCYYCGDCTTNCPQEAKPAELMMSLRRWLTTRYDWTRLSSLFYRSLLGEIIGLLVIAGIILITWASFFGLPTETSAMVLSDMVNPEKIHLIDMTVAIILSGLLISFLLNMHYQIITKDKSIKVPLKLYFSQFGKLIFHFATQWRFSKCETKPESFIKRIKNGTFNYWIVHFIVMTSYAALFFMIMVFIGWFQTDGNAYSWFRLLMVYYTTAGLILGTSYFIISRLRKKDVKSKFSHHSDWTFLILLFLVAATGFIMHIANYTGAPVIVTFYLYLIHLLITIPMLIIEVPFSKWTHLAYRPIAIYLNEIKLAAKKDTIKQKSKK